MSAWVLPDHIADVLPSEARHIEEIRRDLLDMARITGELPRQRALVAIEPAEIGWGLELTPAVAAAMPDAARAARDVAQRFLAFKGEGA